MFTLNSKEELQLIEKQMSDDHFWTDVEAAKAVLKRYEELKAKLREEEEILKGGAIVNIFTGAGGDDAEDWTRMLYEMYSKFCVKNNFNTFTLDQNVNSVGGIKSISFEVSGKNVFKTLKYETGVHRLIRLSLFGKKRAPTDKFFLCRSIT